LATEAQEAPKAQAPKKRYVVLPWTRRGKQKLNLAWREVKMVAPVCENCQEQGLPRWWETCDHNPYVSNIREDFSVPDITDENGHEIPEGTIACEQCGSTTFEQNGVKIKPTFRTQPNTRGVRLDSTVSGGQQPLIQKEVKGWKPVTDLGLAPMCEFSRCYEALTDEFGKDRPSTVRTRFGNYCTREEAQLVALNLDQEAVEVFNEQKRKQQIRNTNI
jgi:hypothetical protein